MPAASPAAAKDAACVRYHEFQSDTEFTSEIRDASVIFESL
jgi:hypothetical protein